MRGEKADFLLFPPPPSTFFFSGGAGRGRRCLKFSLTAVKAPSHPQRKCFHVGWWVMSMRPRAESRRMWETEERERERVMRKRGRWEKRRRRREVVRRASRKPREVGGRKSEGRTAEAAGAPSGWISAAKRMSNKDGDREFNAAAEVKVNFPANRNTKKSSVSTKTCSFTTRFTVCLIKTQIQTDSSSWKHKSHTFGLKTFFFFFFHRKIKGPLLYTDRKTQNKSAQHRPRAHENQQNVKIHSHGRRIRCSFSRCSCFPRHVTSVRVPRSWPRAPRISHPGAFLIRCLKKSQDIQQDSIWLELSSCQPKLYPGVSCCCWRRRTPLCDCRKWRAVKRAQISAERSCSSLKRRRGVKFKFPPWMPKVFFKSSLLQCYITVCGKHRAAVKETQQRRLLQHEASASWIVHISIPYFFSSFAFRNKRTFYTSGNDLYLRLTVSKSHESTKTNRK